MIGSPNQADKSWVTDQYDRYVRGNSVLAQPDDSGMLRIDETTNLGIALSTDANGRYTWLNPYLGAQLSLAEAYRNVAVTGATPVAITDCLNYGSPEDPEVMWSFVESIKGLVDGCATLGTPVTGGNVSFYNQTGDTAILPTPLIGVLGVVDDVTRHTTTGFRAAGDEVWQLGATHEELDGSVWAGVVHQHLGGVPPRVDFAAEQRLAAVMATAAQEGLLTSAHDLSAGGLAVGLVESALRHGQGVRVRLEGDPFVGLFSESVARAVVSVAPEKAGRLAALCAEHGVPAGRLGEVTDDAAVEVEGQFRLGLDALRAAWAAPIRAALA
ncbi:Phosphoribosylformylglycinamidine synthase subunit PurL [bioreactor metagenome]|uniref:Phosphoribosylformylglycinamidine synthase subunit PurL n=1 Tax=bioreactor metagenome TaxID=1076179 RepID=A0A645D420_9ZZZZ